VEPNRPPDSNFTSTESLLAFVGLKQLMEVIVRAREGFDLLKTLLRDRPLPLAVSPKEAANLLGVSVVTIYSEVADGRLRARKLGARTIIETASIRELLENLPQPELTTGRARKAAKKAAAA
jgi:excisionase family DNA binding protein